MCAVQLYLPKKENRKKDTALIFFAFVNLMLSDLITVVDLTD